MKIISELQLKRNKTDILKVKIKDSADSVAFLRNFFFDDISIYESFFLVLLNRNNVTTGYVKISQGGTAGTIVDVKIIAKFAIDSLASSVILCHNHPSGNTAPSRADIQITAKVKEALRLFDIETLDHVILTEDSFYSLADNGEM